MGRVGGDAHHDAPARGGGRPRRAGQPARPSGRGSRPPRAGQLAQRREVLLAEEVLQRPRDLLRRVDLARLEPLEEVLDREIEVHDLVRLQEERVGDGLAHAHAGGALDEVVQALEVLDVERADDVDARGEQLEHVLVALPVLRAGDVGVRDLVDDRDRRAAREHRVEVHLLDGDAAVLDLAAGDDLETADERRGLRPAVRSRRSRPPRRRRAASARAPPRASGRSCRRRRRSRCRA